MQQKIAAFEKKKDFYVKNGDVAIVKFWRRPHFVFLLSCLIFFVGK